MNIFAVNDDPRLAAKDLPDKLVVKMPTESLQLLTPWAFNTFNAYIQKPDGTNYGTKGFAHHPCAKWLYESPANVAWLLCHAIEMCKEYSARYGKQHGVMYGLSQVMTVFVENYGTEITEERTTFVQAMPEECRIPGDPVTAYRNYINQYKGYAEWNHSEKPDWWSDEKHEPIRQTYLAEREAKRLQRKNEKHSKVQRALQSERGV